MEPCFCASSGGGRCLRCYLKARCSLLPYNGKYILKSEKRTNEIRRKETKIITIDSEKTATADADRREGILDRKSGRDVPHAHSVAERV